LNLKNERAIALRAVAVEKIKGGQPFLKHGNGLNLTWLANEIGTSRQVFYPDRCSIEIANVLQTLNKNLDKLNISSMAKTSNSSKDSRVRTHILELRDENSSLRSRIRQLEKLKSSMFATPLLIDLADDDLFS
jgi:hypothetical protein